MALRDQPYLPLYVQDFLTDEKLMECSASATGIYIRVMCIMHKSDEYGTILLKQKDKQNPGSTQNFAIKLAKFLPYTLQEIENGLAELISEGVLKIDGDRLIQKRMVRDNYISEVRSKAGSKGGFAKAKTVANDIAKDIANTEIENEYENESVNVSLEGGMGEKVEQVTILTFDEFWNLYDKKVGEKSKLRKKFDKLSEKDRQMILEHIPRYKLSQPDKQYRKNPETYLNNKSWNDEIIITDGTHQGHIKTGQGRDFNELAEILHKHVNTL